MADNDNQVWISLCSMHRDNRQVDCAACNAGFWIDADKLDADQVLFRTDYAKWFRQANDGREPDNSAWATWEQITGNRRTHASCSTCNKHDPNCWCKDDSGRVQAFAWDICRGHDG